MDARRFTIFVTLVRVGIAVGTESAKLADNLRGSRHLQSATVGTMSASALTPLTVTARLNRCEGDW